MAKNCERCGKKLSLFSLDNLCKECKSAFEAEIAKVENEIIENKAVSDQQLEILKQQKKGSLIKRYFRIYNQFESDKELDETEIEILKKIQSAFNLTNKEVKFDEKVKPYIYFNSIQKGELPTVNLQIEGGGNVVLRKGELVHFADKAILKEMKTINLGYRGGSQGVSIPIVKGVRYRVGSHRGHIAKEEKLVETSQGVLFVTNKRLFLHPSPGHKPVSIPLNKILSYSCYKNGLEVYKEGREKGFFFGLGNSSSPELFGLCLGYLLGS